jgi:hypothetical protein
MLRKIPLGNVYKLVGVSNSWNRRLSARCFARRQRMAHSNLTCIHDADSVVRDNGSQPICGTGVRDNGDNRTARDSRAIQSMVRSWNSFAMVSCILRSVS